MSNLLKFLNSVNSARSLLGKPDLNLDLFSDAQTLANIIDSHVSPENLSCDGELGADAISSRYRVLVTAAKALKDKHPLVTFSELSSEDFNHVS